MIKWILINIIWMMGMSVFSQQNTLLLNSYFKDHLLDNSRKEVYSGSSFLPEIESEYDLNYQIRDSTIQYYDLTEILFKKHLLEFKGENYYLTISPIIELSRGKDFEDTNDRRLFHNTRGIFIEGDLLKNFSFSSFFFENQARFTRYESSYYSAIGELYPNQSSGKYNTQNAVVPGAARTKPFEVDGYDYAYAMGNIVYRPFKKLSLMAGNTQQFIGDGYRSLLLSDNTVPAPHFRIDYKIGKRWEVNIMRMRLLNLMRRPASTSAEAYYESKAYSVNYISYKPFEKLTISLFEGTIWTRGDSITSTKVNPLFYNPLPFLNGLILGENKVNPVLGMNLSFLVGKGHRLYGQFAVTQFVANSTALQLGYRGYNLAGINNLMIQVESNIVSNSMYSSVNDRLNYSHANLPLAHVKGNGFQEYILRGNYEWKRIYADLKTVYYIVKDRTELDLLPVDKGLIAEDGEIIINNVELGYRFNKKMNLTVYLNWQLRNDMNNNNECSWVGIGIRTGLTNRYNDF